MREINIYDSKINLLQLLEFVANGEEIAITKSGRPLARLVPMRHRTSERTLGFLVGKISIGDDFDAPLAGGMTDAFGQVPE